MDLLLNNIEFKFIDLKKLFNINFNIFLQSILVYNHTIYPLINDLIKLKNILTPNELSNFFNITNLNQKVNYLSGKIAIKLLVYYVYKFTSIEVINNPNGVPVVLGLDNFLSLSHSDNLTISCISNLPIGVDIERINWHSSEENLLKWSQKEATFKLISQNNSILFVDFISNYNEFSQDIEIFSDKIEDYVITLAIKMSMLNN